ncbi:RNA polymerase sigma-70 factor (ECF subfamily) [Ciceribacter lividus]|uniref:RNA polymerase sigma-70 factor (ECF subfamily) n=1 Tax=Ciceribacter lividus TaxID=1197950 RepID=A0A6I7HNH4_9HYPH|nr:RNA polymerase factor sigma-70 [Ciceribacter lividus]RCW24074.1 RNA polymerase sigma-70 factor (ECF subfamily) [Ciceribacter lividus]
MSLTAGTFDDPAFLNNLRAQMLKFATLQLSDPVAAEDAVQEALTGALRNATSFGGRSALRTWVFAILKNKIVDMIRQRQRRAEIQPLLNFESDDEETTELFDRRGMWRPEDRPTDWGNPEDELLGKEFWRVFDACLNHLPAQQGRIFMMREFLDMATTEICAEADITVSNLNVLLHRARLRLRGCLESHWFAKETAEC